MNKSNRTTRRDENVNVRIGRALLKGEVTFDEAQKLIHNSLKTSVREREQRFRALHEEAVALRCGIVDSWSDIGRFVDWMFTNFPEQALTTSNLVPKNPQEPLGPENLCWVTP